jgi:hypothetical protein
MLIKQCEHLQLFVQFYYEGSFLIKEFLNLRKEQLFFKGDWKFLNELLKIKKFRVRTSFCENPEGFQEQVFYRTTFAIFGMNLALNRLKFLYGPI